jgi:hypothetical protein
MDEDGDYIVRQATLPNGWLVNYVMESWDWKEHIEIPTLQKMLKAIQSVSLPAKRKVTAYEPDTGGDWYVLILADTGLLNDEQVQFLFDRNEVEEEDEDDDDDE